MFLEIIFDTTLAFNDRICKYSNELKDGIYYYSKTIFYKDYIINFRSHNVYIIIYVKNRQYKNRIFKKYYSGYLEEEIDIINLKKDEKIIKLI